MIHHATLLYLLLLSRSLVSPTMLSMSSSKIIISLIAVSATAEAIKAPRQNAYGQIKHVELRIRTYSMSLVVRKSYLQNTPTNLLVLLNSLGNSAYMMIIKILC